jgi:glycosyltransferase involved in cell wall biosynthesis
MGVPPERVLYVPNCPSPDFLARREQVRQEDKAAVRQTLGIGTAPMAIYIGHITLGDDLDLALVAWRRVLEHVPQAKLVIVGAGEGLAALRSLAADLALDHSVFFTGWIDHEQVPAYLAAADVAVYPYRDTLINRAKCSIKILEYMAMGKAIVTHRVGQNVEYLEHNSSGFLAAPGSVDEFAAGLSLCLTDREHADRLGTRAARRIAHEFSWARRVADVERAYRIACGTDGEAATGSS